MFQMKIVPVNFFVCLCACTKYIRKETLESARQKRQHETEKWSLPWM